MNEDQITGILRAILAAIGTILVNKGYISSDQLTTVLGAILGIATVAWSIVSNRTGKTIGATPGVAAPAPVAK